MSDISSVFGYTIPFNRFILFFSSFILFSQTFKEKLINHAKGYSFSILSKLAYYYDSIRTKSNTLIHTTPRHITKNQYELDYYYHDKKYTIPLKIEAQYIQKLFRIRVKVNESDEFTQSTTAIYDFIKQYLGPNEDCHSLTITPKDLGFYSLELSWMGEDFDTQTKVFASDDTICF